MGKGRSSRVGSYRSDVEILSRGGLLAVAEQHSDPECAFGKFATERGEHRGGFPVRKGSVPRGRVDVGEEDFQPCRDVNPAGSHPSQRPRRREPVMVRAAIRGHGRVGAGDIGLATLKLESGRDSVADLQRP